MENHSAIVDRELAKKLLDLQFRLIAKRYGRLAVQFAKFFIRDALTKERLAWIAVFFVILHGVAETVDSCSLLCCKFRKKFSILFDNLLLYEICLFMTRGAMLVSLIVLGSALFSFGVSNVVPVMLVTLLHFFGWMYIYRKRPAKIMYLLLGQCIWVFLFAIYFGWTIPQ